MRSHQPHPSSHSFPRISPCLSYTDELTLEGWLSRDWEHMDDDILRILHEYNCLLIVLFLRPFYVSGIALPLGAIK
ncbi:hypothetical protein PanWU01x14_355060 [Parasponia andersonii]|uniref:Uncharacterized protein n=1 Tax=Parasponia andersonii TaxID=3476 RepID=A0A2P5A9C3_PARAD|nr:hypothetical protein PanWU01x14_355060 [Parasponia andersonii]